MIGGPIAQSRIWAIYFSLSIFIFAASFFFVESSKLKNTIFYALCAFPALFFMRDSLCAHGRNPVLWSLCGFLICYAITVSFSDGFDFSLFKYAAYLLCLFVALDRAARSPGDAGVSLLLFAVLCFSLGAHAVISWGAHYVETEEFIRFRLKGGIENPIRAALVVLGGWLAFWFLYGLPRCRARGVWTLALGYAVMLAFAILVCFAFQARSALLGLGMAVVAYAMISGERRVAVVLLLLTCIGALSAALLFPNLVELVVSRGLSHRPEIWADGLARLASCGIWLGCGLSDSYLYAGKHIHAHSAFLSVIIDTGLVGSVALVIFATLFIVVGFRSRSAWFAVAMLGWGGSLTTSSGLINSPTIIWIYFWIPTLLALSSYTASLDKTGGDSARMV